MTSSQASLPPHDMSALLFQMIIGYCVSQAPYLVAKLSIADLVKEGPKSTAESRSGRVWAVTSCRVRQRRSPSWRPEIANNKPWVKLPEKPSNIALSGQKGLLING